MTIQNWNLSTYEAWLNEKYPDDKDHGQRVSQYHNLLKALNEVDTHVLFISFGCAGAIREQQIPTYLQNIAYAAKVQVFLIDGRLSPSQHHKFESIFRVNKLQEGHYVLQDNPNLAVKTFKCFLDSDGFFDVELKKAIERVLNQGGKVFLANHTQAFSLDWIPSVADIYNQVKTTNAAGHQLQLYTQSGESPVRYYLDKLCDWKHDSFDRRQEYEPEADEFNLCESISQLSAINAFKPAPCIEERLKILSDMGLLNHLAVFKAKIAAMKLKEKENVKYTPAIEAAEQFCVNLQEAQKQFLRKEQPINQAKEELYNSCEKACELALKTLGQHREWKGEILKFLADMMSFLTFKLSARCGIFAKTASHKLVDDVKSSMGLLKM